MTTQRAEQIIVISLFVMMASTVGGSLAGHKNKSRTGKIESNQKYYGKAISGGFFTMLVLSLLAEVAPDPAAYMSVAVSSYAFLHYGAPAVFPNFEKETAGVGTSPIAESPFTEPAIELGAMAI